MSTTKDYNNCTETAVVHSISNRVMFHRTPLLWIQRHGKFKMSAIEFFSAFYAMHAIVVLYMESMTTSSICNLHNINILNIESRQKCLCFEQVSIFLVKIFIPKFVELLKCLNQNNSKSSWLNLNDESILSKLSLQINCPIFFYCFLNSCRALSARFARYLGKLLIWMIIMSSYATTFVVRNEKRTKNTAKRVN